ncbi:jerky protein homolog-like isoform X2 [Leptopilina heterotoma]|uniref:jerky protein homolog-like isoform X2 n=1 Tax=Leptopilina heterotoma TaxID=63436 RepID=UPI001CAA3B59|nr:jerky protein homolog-like isoform X2 [Leptopilina heterotoma]
MSVKQPKLDRKVHVYRSLREKLNIIEAVNNGEKMTSVAKRYNISITAVSKLVKKKNEKIKYSSTLDEQVLKKRKTFRKVHDSLLEKSLLMWYNEKCLNGQPVSGPALCEKALIFNDKLNGSKEFKASFGWLDRFKKRNAIQFTLQGEKLTANVDSAIEYCFQFQNLISEENYNLSLVFNADESGIFWKSLPEIDVNDKQNFQGQNQTTDRITCLFCGNADSTYALPLLIIGKSWSSRSTSTTSDNIQQLPVMYQNQSSAYMTEDIFLDWYTNIFIPSVQEMQEKTKTYGKVLLVIDPAKCHPSKEILNSVNERFQVEYLKANIAHLVQPMGQGVIDKTKRMYRRTLITNLLNADENTTVDEFMKQYTMEDFCFMLSNAFESVTTLNLKNAWNKLCGVSPLDEENLDPDEKILDYKTFCQMVHRIKGYENVHPASVRIWLNADFYDPGWELLTDEEIIEFVTSRKKAVINSLTPRK